MLVLFAVLFMHGLQCGSAADGAAHTGADPMIPLTATATAAGDAHRVDATAAHPGPLAAVPHAAGQVLAGALMSAHGGTSDLGAGHLWAVCLAVLAAGLAVLLTLLGSRLAPLARPAPTRALARTAGSLPRAPDLHALCLLRT
ncbi:MAG TPA: hypothetical protein VHF92_18655 [Geodermatophilus sp.]|nr:hypothetical protein [Geodermatophilus sp.]